MTLKEIINYRKVWMGIAILWVILLHFGVKLPSALYLIQLIGYGGVDIFFFSSGIGCYYSYSRDRNPASFLKRRFKKIMPTYIIFIVVWCIYRVVELGMDFPTVLGNMFCIQNYTGKGGEFNWYIGAMWVSYLLTPYFVEFVEKIKNPIHYLFFTIFLILFSIPFWNVPSLLIAYSRIPIYFIGITFAKYSKYVDVKIPLKTVVCMTVFSVIGLVALFYTYFEKSDLLWNFGMWWYPFILIAPTICIYLSFISRLFEKNIIGRKAVKGISFIGNYTFELFLVHAFIFEVLRRYINEHHPVHAELWFISIPFVALGTFLLNRLTCEFRKFYKKFFIKRITENIDKSTE